MEPIDEQSTVENSLPPEAESLRKKNNTSSDTLAHVVQRLKDFAADDNSSSESRDSAIASATPIDTAAYAEDKLVVTPDNPVESRIIDPEVEYQRALEEIREEEDGEMDPFVVFEQFTEPNRDVKPDRPTRRFTAVDRARHRLLAIRAQRQGITDVEQFKSVVECLEMNLEGFIEDSGRFNVSADHIPVIKAMLDTGVDPIPFIKAIEPNAHLLGLLASANLEFEGDTTTFIGLLKTPNAERLLPIIQGMAQVPHSKWGFKSYGDTITQTETLINLAETGNIPDYEPEFFDKVGIIARSLGIDVEIEDLPDFEALISNQNKLLLLATAMKSGNLDECFLRLGRFPRAKSVCEALDSLNTNGLTVPLMTLMRLGISLNSRDVDHFDYSRRTQDQINQDLLKIVTSPETQAILADQERQEFTQILRKMAGGPVKPKQVDDLYENRQDLVALNAIVFGSLDTEFDDRHGTRNKVQELNDLLVGGREGIRRQILLSPEFQQYIIDLREKGITIESQDYFKYAEDAFGYGEHPPYQSVLVQLYQGRDLTDILDPEMPKRIIEGYREKYSGEKLSIAWADMRRLKAFAPYIGTFKLLQDAGIPIPSDRLTDANWIGQIHHMPLMNYKIRDQIPPDKLNEWINTVITLPYNIQEGLQHSFLQETDPQGYAERLMIVDFDRVKNLSELITSSNFFSKDYFVDWNVQELYTVLGDYHGDVRTLFTNGQPNAELVKLLIDLKKPSATALVLSEDICASFDSDARVTLEAWLDFPPAIQVLAFGEEQFPALKADLVDRYKVAADVIHFGYPVERIDDLLGIVATIDLGFIHSVVDELGGDSAGFFTHYVDGIKSGQITQTEQVNFLNEYKIFQKTKTTFSHDRLEIYHQEEVQQDAALLASIPDEVDRACFIMDCACYRQRGEANKLATLERLMRNDLETSQKMEVLQFLRWLPDKQIEDIDTYESLRIKYQESLSKLGDGFEKLFPDSRQLLDSSKSTNHLRIQLDSLSLRFGIKTRQVTINGVVLALPEDFIREFNKQRHQDLDARCIPELSKYFIDQLTKQSTAYTVEDLLYSQIGETEDTTGRRRGQYTSEQLLEVMEDNIEASVLTWKTAIEYQQEVPNSPLVIIANERTGPSDLAAEYLPEEFASEFTINQKMDYDSLFTWFKVHQEQIDTAYQQNINGEEIDADLLRNAREQLGIKGNNIIPIYRLKIPSSLNGARDEPEGIETIISFLKLTSIVGGRTLFMDESTRSAPRSIECLYNVLRRRQEVLGGVNIRLFDKIKGVKGQNDTLLEEVQTPNNHIEIGFIDPWHSQRKSITDDSTGFVPEIEGKGIVEVVEPSYASVNPYGAATIQDFWKELIAAEVSHRYNRSKGARE